jgi:hypothetical protein
LQIKIRRAKTTEALVLLQLKTFNVVNVDEKIHVGQSKIVPQKFLGH